MVYLEACLCLVESILQLLNGDGLFAITLQRLPQLPQVILNLEHAGVKVKVTSG